MPEKVENFKLTKNFKDFQKRYKDVLTARNAIAGQLFRIQLEGENLMQMYQRLNGQLNMLKPPEGSVDELQGMPDRRPEGASAPKFEILY